MHKIIILIVVVVAVIAGGYLAFTYFTSQNQPGEPSVPRTEQIRDQTMLYIKANHTQTAHLMANLEWIGGKQETGLLGSEVYVYTSGGWLVEIQYPVVLDPVYTITVNYTSSDQMVEWTGTYHNGVITETSSSIQTATEASLTQEQVRDLAMNYIKTYHQQTAQYMQTLSWSGGRTTPEGLVGAEIYVYQSTGWTVIIQYPVVPNPVYTITAEYASLTSQVYSENMLILWEGKLQNGVITETNYKFNI